MLPIEHIRTKSMWIGSHDRVDYEYAYDGNKFYKTVKKHSPGILKIFEEIISNSIDHHTIVKGVNNINVKFDIITGKFSCYNDGPSIPIIFDDTSHKYLPELFFTKPYFGTKLKIDNSTLGGTNGIGAKLVTALSDSLKILLHDDNIIYEQLIIKDGNSIKINNPILEKNNTKIRGTEVITDVSYDIFKYNNDDYEELSNILRLRLYILAQVFDVKITFNDNILIKDMENFFNLLGAEKENIILCENIQFKIYIGISKKQAIINKFSVINNLPIFKGSHFKKVDKLINNMFSLESIKKKNFSFFIYGNIENIEWQSQSKDLLKIDDDKLKNITISKEDEKKIKLLYYTLHPVSQKKIKDYNFTYFPSKKKYGILLVGEGKSAMSFLKEFKENSPDKDYIGIFSLKGVLMNALKNSTVYKDKIIRPNGKLEKNEVIKLLMSALNISFSTHINLKYSEIICCVDQDIDGMGKILSLLLLLFYLYWPDMLKNKRIKVLKTPLITCKINNKYSEYFSTEEFNKVKDKNITSVSYNKGLASFSDEEIVHISKNRNKYVYTFIYEECYELFDSFFGKNPEKRKEILKIPAEEYMYLLNEIKCNEHLLSETKKYKIAAISRQLVSPNDGLNTTRRKIIYASMTVKSLSNTLKVSQASGYISATMKYHHGESSINKTIILMAQNYPGSNVIPLLNGKGQFGTRDSSGSDHGQPRYVSVSPSKVLEYLFPAKDFPVYDYNYDDGCKVEPKSLVGIIPYSILINLSIPTEGWKADIWARDVFSVMELVKKIINNEKYESYIKPYDDGYKGSIVFDSYGDEYMKGFVGKNNGLLTITEIPYRISFKRFIESLEKKEGVKIVSNDSLKNSINITIESDVEKVIPYMVKKMSKNLNYVYDGRVVSFDDYINVVKFWFNNREELYEKRFLRQKVYIENARIYYTNVIKYINSNISSKKSITKNFESLLESKGIIKFNESSLSDNKSDLNTFIKKSKSNLSYKYIWNLKQSDVNKHSLDLYSEKLLKLNDKLLKIDHYLSENPVGKTKWLKEIDKLYLYLKNLKK